MRAFLSSLLVFLASFSLNAQSPFSIKDLKGNWKMVAFNMSGIYYDWGADSLKLDADLQAQVEPGTEADVVADIKQRLQPYTDGKVRITDNNYEQTLSGETARGTYTLLRKGNIQYYVL